MLLDLAQQQSGDEKARKNEEDIDADKAAGNPGHVEMIGYDRQHGQRAQPLQIGPTAARRTMFSTHQGCLHRPALHQSTNRSPSPSAS